MAPPVAANPVEYVASAIDPNAPELLPTRKRRPGSRIVDVVQVAFRVTVDPDEVA